MKNQSTSGDPVLHEHLLKLRGKLILEWGIDFHRIRALVCQLTNADWHSISELIALNALSHWNVTQLVRELDTWIERSGEQVRIRSEFSDAIKSAFDCYKVSDESMMTPYEVAAQVGKVAETSDAVIASMSRIVKELPISPVRHLDHVSATPLTCVKRALFLSKNYELEGAKILFLGDHDLTSIALAHFCTDTELTVVDVDERILSYISAVSERHGWRIRTIFADFRVELPRSLAECCDLVFTDPPYTLEGIGLFLKRGIESLKHTDYARLLFCYGFSERRPELAFKVQSMLYQLRLVMESILPDFNRYSGAEAIGSSAALYICRPTRRSLPAAEALKGDPRIYTQGKSAEEAVVETLPVKVVETVKREIAEIAHGNLTFVGEGWPKDMTGAAQTTSLSGYLRTMYTMHRQAGKSHIATPHADTVVVNLYPHYNAYLMRILLVAAAEDLIIAVADNVQRTVFNLEEQDPLRILVECKYRIHSVERGDAQRPAVILLKQVPPTEASAVSYVLRYIVDHRHAKLVNAWREALVSWFDLQGHSISKNQVREVIEQCRLARIHEPGYLSELPLDGLRKLVTDVNYTLEQLELMKEKTSQDP